MINENTVKYKIAKKFYIVTDKQISELKKNLDEIKDIFKTLTDINSGYIDEYAIYDILGRYDLDIDEDVKYDIACDIKNEDYTEKRIDIYEDKIDYIMREINFDIEDIENSEIIIDNKEGENINGYNS